LKQRLPLLLNKMGELEETTDH